MLPEKLPFLIYHVYGTQYQLYIHPPLLPRFLPDLISFLLKLEMGICPLQVSRGAQCRVTACWWTFNQEAGLIWRVSHIAYPVLMKNLSKSFLPISGQSLTQDGSHSFIKKKNVTRPCFLKDTDQPFTQYTNLALTHCSAQMQFLPGLNKHCHTKLARKLAMQINGLLCFYWWSSDLLPIFSR